MSNLMPLSTLQALSVHPAADAFPYISDEEILNLAQDIELNGLVHPIVLFENEILDGRNRLRALAKTKLAAVPVVEYDGTDPVGYVLSLNVHRRHLSVYDWVEVGYKLKPIIAEQAHDKMVATLAQNASPDSPVSPVGESGETIHTHKIVADKLQGAVSANTLHRGWRVMEDKPELWEEAKRTGTGIATAYSKMLGKAGPAATPGDKVKPEPQPEMGVDTGTTVTWDEREVSYEERRATATEVLIRNAERIAETITRYALTDGDIADAAEQLSPETARLLADFFEALA